MNNDAENKKIENQRKTQMNEKIIDEGNQNKF